MMKKTKAKPLTPEQCEAFARWNCAVHAHPYRPPHGDESIDAALRRKLTPNRFGFSRQWGAVIGYILGIRWSSWEIADLTVTRGGLLCARYVASFGLTAIIGTVTELERKWSWLMRLAGLTEHERIEAECRFAARIGTRTCSVC